MCAHIHECYKYETPHPLTHWPTHPPTHTPMGRGVSTNHKSSNNWIILIRSRFIKFLVIWPDPTHWPLTHSTTHPWVGVSLQIINLQTELNYLDWVNIYYIFSDLTWPHPWTHPSTNPPTHKTIYPPMGGVSTESSKRIELSWLVQLLLNFYWFWGPTPGGWWVGGLGWGLVWVCGRCPMHACMCTHAHTCMLNMINMDASKGTAFCNFYTCIHVHVCVYACMCMWTCMGTCPWCP